MTAPPLITSATLDDLPTVIEIYDEAAYWLRERGLGGWPHPQPQWIIDTVRQDIEQGLVYLCRAQDGRAIGTLRLLWSDPEVWPEEAGDAGYVHGLAIRNDVRGQRVGERMLEWAKDSIRSRGRRYLRLDCDAGNVALRRYYETRGFTFRGKLAQERHVAARYEMKLTNT